MPVEKAGRQGVEKTDERDGQRERGGKRDERECDAERMVARVSCEADAGCGPREAAGQPTGQAALTR